MKKLTLLLLTACFAVNIQAQMVGEARQVKALKDFKLTQSRTMTIPATANKMAAIELSKETDTLYPQCMYMPCAQDGKLYSYTFGSPAAGAPDEGQWSQILGGTNNAYNYYQCYFPLFYSGDKEYKFGDDRAVSGVIMWVNREKSPRSSMETVPSSMSLFDIDYQTFWNTTDEAMGQDVTDVPIPSKLQCTSQNIDIPYDINAPGYTEEKQFNQVLIYEFPCKYTTPSHKPFAVRWNLPRDSSLLVLSLSFKAGCKGEEFNAAGAYMPMDYFYTTEGTGAPYLPETNPQYNNDSVYAPISILFREYFEFYWRPVVNTVSANDDINSIDFKASIYPIPASSEITISSLYKMNDIKIYNMAGQLIKTLVANDNIAFVDITSLNNGVYIAKVNTEKGLITKKIIVKK
ncbi:MAG: T9SS type A sorting domain-containing protein [Bacteroidales bacterium]